MTNTTRRGFLGAVGALAATLAVPTWLIDNRRLPIDLSAFCEQGNGWTRPWAIKTPFHQEGYTYATDARICARIPGGREFAVDEQKRPRAFALWWQHADPAIRWQPWPKERLIEGPKLDWGRTCPACRGKGRLGANVGMCGRCDGEGDLLDATGTTAADWEVGMDYPPCPDCRGCGYRGGVACDYCDGRGDTFRPTLQQVGSLVVAGDYSRLVAGLPGAEFTVRRIDVSTRKKGHEDVVVWRAEGAEGLLMPVDISVR